VVDQSTQRIQSFRTARPAAPDGRPSAAYGPSPVYAAHGRSAGVRSDGNRPNGRGFDPHSASIGELVSHAAGQISTLVRGELALGKAELAAKAKKLGLGGGLLAAAGLFGLFSLGLLVTLFVVVLDRDWPLWLAVLVPLLVLGVLTLGLAGLGVSRLRAGASAPTTANSVRDDIESVKRAIRDARAANHQAQRDARGANHQAAHGGRQRS
jgi:hypothetical protein